MMFASLTTVGTQAKLQALILLKLMPEAKKNLAPSLQHGRAS